MNTVFYSSLEHILAELTRIDIKVRVQLLNMRLKDGNRDKDDFNGLFIPEEEIDAFLATSHLQSDRCIGVETGSPSLKALTNTLQAREAEIAERKTLSLNNGVTLRLVKLAEQFHLSPFDVDALLVCLLPEIEPGYEKLYAYIRDDVTKKSVDVELVLRLLCQSTEERIPARRAFSTQATLVKHLLIRVDDDSPNGMNSFLTRHLQLDERILDYLLGSDLIDTRLVPFASISTSLAGLADVVLSESTKQRLIKLVTSHRGNMVCYFQGPCGAGKQTTAEALCHDANIPLLIVQVEKLLVAELPPTTAIQLLFRESKLLGTALYWDRFDLLLAEDRNPYLNSVIYGLENCPRLNFLAGEVPWERSDALRDVPFVDIPFSLPSYEARKKLWKSSLNSHCRIDDTVELSALSNKFVLTGGQIRDAVADAQNLALWQESERLCMEDLYHSCSARSNQKLGVLAHKIDSKYTWADIVLPDDQIQQLHELMGYVKHRQIVYEEWNFDQKFSYGKGLNVLFTGPSGTGKTLAASIMANELKLDIYKIDLSSVVSKYIGETEKNLAKIFNEAERSNAILFFDEADALFGKRSEVRDSHDRYANIEISYLLQRMEEFEGMVILATNLHKNMDDAFARRMHFIVEFPLPEEDDRYRIWNNIFPSEAPLAKDIDFRFLAQQFKIAGGNIKNIALNAAFLAAGDASAITMKHLMCATRREFQKMGKLCVAADFGKYHALLASGNDGDG